MGPGLLGRDSSSPDPGVSLRRPRYGSSSFRRWSTGPSSGILPNDLILGASGTAAAPAPFDINARRGLAAAIADAEAQTPAQLKLIRWRAETQDEVTLRTMRAYTATAPYSRPKSEKILEEGVDYYYNSENKAPNGSEYYDFHMSTAMLLTYALPLQSLHITGRDSTGALALSPGQPPFSPAFRSGLGRRSAAETPPTAVSGASRQKQIPSNLHQLQLTLPEQAPPKIQAPLPTSN